MRGRTGRSLGCELQQQALGYLGLVLEGLLGLGGRGSEGAHGGAAEAPHGGRGGGPRGDGVPLEEASGASSQQDGATGREAGCGGCALLH